MATMHVPSYVTQTGVTLTNAPVVIQRVMGNPNRINYTVQVYASDAALAGNLAPVETQMFNIPNPGTGPVAELLTGLYADLAARSGFTGLA